VRHTSGLRPDGGLLARRIHSHEFGFFQRGDGRKVGAGTPAIRPPIRAYHAKAHPTLCHSLSLIYSVVAGRIGRTEDSWEQQILSRQEGAERWKDPENRRGGSPAPVLDLSLTTPYELSTATLTLDTVIFILLHEMLAREPYHITRHWSQYLAEHPEIVCTPMEHIDPCVDALCTLVILESVTEADIPQMRHEMRTSGILPRDAIHLAVMKRRGLAAIASDDEGFDNRQDIRLLQP
jgi:predicted nucleic acid-binding protein